jgi:predicted glycogen debranching enzyme
MSARESLPVRSFDRASFTEAGNALSREWLVTNGLGGFASGTVALANTRRYHGLLVAALRPPVERVLMLAKLDVRASLGGATFDLACNEFAGEVRAPEGFRHLARFELEGQTPVWTYAIADARLEQRIWMEAGRNVVYVRFTHRQGGEPLELDLLPLCAYRDYHGHQRGPGDFRAEVEGPTMRIVAFDGATPLVLTVKGAELRGDADWYWQFHHRIEAERGLDATEDLYLPGVFRVRLGPGESATFVAGTAPDVAAIATAPIDGAAAWQREARRQGALAATAPSAAPDWLRSLTLAADQYIVARTSRDDAGASSRVGATVIAGYPWFADWGRDTMIALPGLALATGRLDVAASILRTFAAHVSEGMLPNRFPDGGEPPEYNTADATLWYFHAIDAYLGAGGDPALLAEIFPVLEEIIAWHVRGTRYGIGMDERDGLLRAGVPGVQLTWMDAKVGDRVITPRIGKPVEINALWHFALAAMARWAHSLRRRSASLHRERAERAARAFAPAFWNPQSQCLFDVVDAPGDGHAGEACHKDATIRPNQIFAVSLGGDLLEPAKARSVVETCARELLTPVGLRSLAPRDAAYVARYAGDPGERDSSYHQGTVWGWLLGPYALAHFRVYRDRAYAAGLLEDMSRHLDAACVGHISEIFDAEPPHAPRGCPAQAWSVAETLRAWHVLEHESRRNRSAVTGVATHG